MGPNLKFFSEHFKSASFLVPRHLILCLHLSLLFGELDSWWWLHKSPVTSAFISKSKEVISLNSNWSSQMLSLAFCKLSLLGRASLSRLWQGCTLSFRRNICVACCVPPFHSNVGPCRRLVCFISCFLCRRFNKTFSVHIFHLSLEISSLPFFLVSSLT